MKILYDHQIFESQKFGGISRYFYELFVQLSKSHSPQISINVSVNDYLLNDMKIRNQLTGKGIDFDSFCFGLDFLGKRLLYNWVYHMAHSSNEKLSIRQLTSGSFDVFHPTYYSDYFESYVKEVPMVVTIHDMIPELFSEKLIGSVKKICKRKRYLCEQSERIIAVSDSTKKDLMTLYNIPSEKIDVIHLGNSLFPVEHDSTFEQLHLPKKYLLFVGTRKGYKNFQQFVSSAEPVLKQDNSLYIVCTGSKFSREEKGFLNDLGLKDKVMHRYVDDRALSWLYQKAVAFVFPSLYEGFGIPVLEAFNCGCPALLSSSSSLPEIGGDAALYFDPENRRDITAAIEKILCDQDLRDQMIRKGYKQAELFSWQETANLTADTYRKVLKQS